MSRKFIDITGKVFGLLTVLCFVESKKNNGRSERLYFCRCYCGRDITLTSTRIIRDARNCGCIRRMRNQNQGLWKKRDLIGQRFGMLTVIKSTYNNLGTGKPPKCLCKCDCGNEKYIASNSLVTKATKSCGCISKNRFKNIKLYLKKEKICKICNLSFKIEYPNQKKCSLCREIKDDTRSNRSNRKSL